MRLRYPALLLLLFGCTDGGTAFEPAPMYEPATGELMRLDVDTNGDSAIDARTYTRGARVFRSEIDLDSDGHVDRWEYVTTDHRITMVGTASTPGGTEDTWTFAAADGEVRVDRVINGQATRREFYRAEALTRSEEDTNLDGLTDKWEAYEHGRLRSVAVDTSQSFGRADRRLFYDENGRYSHLEIDSDRDGTFERVHQ